jgi:DNA repair protein RadC
MSNHNLCIHRADGTVEPASSQEILTAARAVLAHRVRRGALLQSPKKVGEYLTMRLGHLDYECFGLILVDGRHRVIDCVELFRGTIDGASVYPREVVKLVLERGAAAALAVHYVARHKMNVMCSSLFCGVTWPLALISKKNFPPAGHITLGSGTAVTSCSF